MGEEGTHTHTFIHVYGHNEESSLRLTHRQTPQFSQPSALVGCIHAELDRHFCKHLCAQTQIHKHTVPSPGHVKKWCSSIQSSYIAYMVSSCFYTSAALAPFIYCSISSTLTAHSTSIESGVHDGVSLSTTHRGVSQSYERPGERWRKIKRVTDGKTDNSRK